MTRDIATEVDVVRRMRDARYREQQWQERYAAHVAPINGLVDELGAREAEGRPPYVAPMYRGVQARVLAILRDPGPRAGGVKGSGFLSIENDDPTAERQSLFFAEAGIDASEVVPWNAYPWYINAAPTKDQLGRGVEPLRRLIELMPDLRVVLLAGKDAQAAWELFSRRYGAWTRSRGIRAVATYHPSRQALQHPDPAERGRREDHIRASLREVAVLIGGGQPLQAVEVAVRPAPMGIVDVDVVGRPATFATASEAAWRAAVTEAVGDRVVPELVRFAVEIEFRLPIARTRNEVWDLDNLIKPTLDALGGVIGWRSWQGRPQADDERIDRIVASKRAVTDGEVSGARIRVVPLPWPQPGFGVENGWST